MFESHVLSLGKRDGETEVYHPPSAPITGRNQLHATWSKPRATATSVVFPDKPACGGPRKKVQHTSHEHFLFRAHECLIIRRTMTMDFTGIKNILWASRSHGVVHCGTIGCRSTCCFRWLNGLGIVGGFTRYCPPDPCETVIVCVFGYK